VKKEVVEVKPVVKPDRPFGSLKIGDNLFMGDRTAAKVSI